MARGTGPRALRKGPLRVEVERMRIDLERPHRAVTGRAIILRMTARAGLEVLASGLAVSDQPERAALMVVGSQPLDPRQASFCMTRSTKGLGVVAGRALSGAAKSRRGVARHEGHRVIAASGRAFVTLHTKSLDVARRTRARVTRGERGVHVHEEERLVAFR